MSWLVGLCFGVFWQFVEVVPNENDRSWDAFDIPRVVPPSAAGTSVFVICYPLGDVKAVTVTEGEIANNAMWWEKIAITATTAGDNSGGGVFTADGLLGIMTSFRETFSEFYPLSVIHTAWKGLVAAANATKNKSKPKHSAAAASAYFPAELFR